MKNKTFKQISTLLLILTILTIPTVQAQTYIGLKRLTVGSPDADWLTGWGYRFAITLNSTKVDEELTDFPLLINITSSSGEGSDDLTAIFDEVGADYNATAYTSSDGQTRLYFDPTDGWNSTAEEASIWVKVPTVSNTTNTIIYIYYDSTQDGSAYNSPNDVWDSNFKLVSHMNDNPDTSHIADSTSNGNDGTKKAANEPLEIDGNIAKAQNFDAIDDIIDFGAIDYEDKTIMFWAKKDDGTQNTGIFCRYSSGAYDSYIRYKTDWFSLENDAGIGTHLSHFLSQEEQEMFNHFALKMFNGKFYLFVNGINISEIGFDGLINLQYFGVGYGADTEFDGILDELQVYDGDISDAWVGASYQTQTDSLVDYSTSSGTYSSTVTVKNLEENFIVTLWNGTSSIANATVGSSGVATLTLPVTYRTNTFTGTFKVYDSDGDLLFLDEYTDAKGGDVFQSLETATTGGVFSAILVGIILLVLVVLPTILLFMRRRR